MFHKAVRLSYQASEFTKILKHNLSNGHKGRDFVAQVRQLAIVDVVGAVASNVGKAVSGAAARRWYMNWPRLDLEAEIAVAEAAVSAAAVAVVMERKGWQPQRMVHGCWQGY